MDLNAHNFEEVYKWLGINLNQLGCVMLPLEFIPEPDSLKGLAYTSDHPERFWIDGWVASYKAHVTLLYGLIHRAQNIEPHIRDVLDGWKCPHVFLDHVGFFPSPYPDEKYWCIIAHIRPDQSLVEGHSRLSFLPHINTFPRYTPHMTLGYIQCDEKVRDTAIKKLDKELVGQRIKVTGDIDLGKP